MAELEKSNRSLLAELKVTSEKLKELDVLADEKSELTVRKRLLLPYLPS